MHTPHRIVPKIIVVAAAGVIALVAILFAPSPSPAEPVIRWESNAITENITPGVSKTLSVSFVSANDITDIMVRVVPELEPFVQTSPPSFARVSKGETATLSISITAGQYTPLGVFDGTIQLRSANKILAQPLPVNVTASVVPVPPDPGEAGKATLEGIDSDNDGVRDDIQRYIVLTYPNSEKTRAGLTQLAVTYQDL